MIVWTGLGVLSKKPPRTESVLGGFRLLGQNVEADNFDSVPTFWECGCSFERLGLPEKSWYR